MGFCERCGEDRPSINDDELDVDTATTLNDAGELVPDIEPDNWTETEHSPLCPECVALPADEYTRKQAYDFITELARTLQRVQHDSGGTLTRDKLADLFTAGTDALAPQKHAEVVKALNELRITSGRAGYGDLRAEVGRVLGEDPGSPSIDAWLP
jgi:hypothetical protein